MPQAIKEVQHDRACTQRSHAAAAGFTHRQILVIMSGLMAGMLLAALDQTIVATAIRTIADDLHGYALQAWVTTAYLITATLSTPLYGKLSDMYGRRPFYLAAIVIFVVGSVLCTTAQSMYELAAFRALQGLGAGGLMSLALTIMGDIVSPRERARYQGYFMAVFATSSVVGPVLGGLFAGADSIVGIAGWRWVFLVNVPVGMVAFAIVFRVLRLPNVFHPDVRIDWFGAVAMAIGLVPLLIVAEQGREWGWDQPEGLDLLRRSACSVWLGSSRSRRRMREAALIPLRIFRNSTFSIGIGISIVVGAAMFGGIVLIPQYLQVVRGSSPTLAGLQMLPLVIGLMAASITSGRIIAHTGRYRIFPLVGSVLLMLGAYLLHFVSAVTPMWVVMAFMAITGFGIGNLMPPLMLALQNALPARDMGISTAAATFFRQIGGTLGVAVFLSILFSQLAGNIADQLRAAGDRPEFRQAVAAGLHSSNPADAALANGLAGNDPSAAQHVLTDSSIVQQLSPALARPFQDGFADSMSTVFLVVTGDCGGRAGPRAVLEGGAAAHPGRTAGARDGGEGMSHFPSLRSPQSHVLSPRQSLRSPVSGRPAPSAGRTTARPRPRPRRGRPTRSP